MKRIIVSIMIIVFVFSFAGIALADGTTTLTTTVPDNVTYTLNIPEDQVVPFNTSNVYLQYPYVTDAVNFTAGKSVKITITPQGYFESDTVETTIPYSFSVHHNTAGGNGHIKSSDGIFYLYAGGNSSSNVVAPYGEAVTLNYNVPVTSMDVYIESRNWGKALPGDYSTVITFSSEIVTS